MKALLFSPILLAGILCSAATPESLSTQAERLHQYAGEWHSSVSPDSDEVSSTPMIKMINRSMQQDRSLHVDVLMYRDGKYVSILVEQISYDAKSDQIVALGQNEAGKCFIGKGRFVDDRRWSMLDLDLEGNELMRVEFAFLSPTEVMVEGISPAGDSLWKMRYLKANPSDKTIGIQLVSVHDDMQRDAKGTLRELGRMGYEFVETFVYRDRSFYGMTPREFRGEVESAGMRFLGSMTFRDLPDATAWQESMNWWETCIQDHLAAGVEYLTTSNNQLKSLQSLDELQRYCEYYNAIGKLCRESGLKFAFHNHADEFGWLEGVRIYDYLLEHTDPKLVSFQADIYWMDVGGVSAAEYFRAYPGRFLSWHVKDYQELGHSGKIDWVEIFDATSHPIVPYVVAEVEDYNFPPMYSVQLAWEYLHHGLLK